MGVNRKALPNQVYQIAQGKTPIKGKEKRAECMDLLGGPVEV